MSIHSILNCAQPTYLLILKAAQKQNNKLIKISLLLWNWKDTHCIHNSPKIPVEDNSNLCQLSFGEDLSTLDDNYDPIWVEIKNYKSKNFLFCCVYKHPATDISSFIDHIDLTLQKVQKENKTVVREDSQINFVTRNVPWTLGGGDFVLDVSFVTNKHRFLSIQNFQ